MGARDKPIDASRFGDIGLDEFEFEPMVGEGGGDLLDDIETIGGDRLHVDTQPDGSITVERRPAWERFVNDGLEHMTITPPEEPASVAPGKPRCASVIYVDANRKHWKAQLVPWPYKGSEQTIVVWMERRLHTIPARESNAGEPGTWHAT